MTVRPSTSPWRWLLRLAGASLGLLLLTMAALAVDGLTDHTPPSDVAIVLGSKVGPDGRLSPRLAGRTARGLELYRAGVVRELIVSGATGPEGADEALAMRAWLIARGVPSADVLVDSRGVNSWETARNASALMRRHGWSRAIVVSQYFHTTRARLALRRFGVGQVGTAHARYFELRDAYGLARDAIAWWTYALRERPKEGWVVRYERLL